MLSPRVQVSAASAAAVRQFFFVHVMKTGGTSFRSHLHSQFRADEVYPFPELDWRYQGDIEAYVSAKRFLEVDAERSAGVRVFSGHVPFVVTELMGGGFVTISLLRDPVERTVSVLKHFRRLHRRFAARSLEEVYEDPVVFRHFVENHQTKVFSLSRGDRMGAFASAVGYRLLHAALGDSSVNIFGGDDDSTPAAADEEKCRAAREQALASDATVEVDDARLARAKQNIGALDVLGFDDRYAAMVDELRRRFGWWPGGLDLSARANVSSEPRDVPVSLRRRIERDNAADIELHAFALGVAAERDADVNHG